MGTFSLTWSKVSCQKKYQMKFLLSILLANAIRGQDPTNRITCYECSYRISEKGDESGNPDCMNPTNKTPYKSYKKIVNHEHHGPGQNTKSRTDCAVVQGSGVETLIEKGIPIKYKFQFIARHEFDNYEDTASYDYGGGSLAGVEYRERTSGCGANIDRCQKMTVQFPINPVRSIRSVSRAELPTQECPMCEKEEYMSTMTNNWVTTGGNADCDRNLNNPNIQRRTCAGLCVVDQEEWLFNGGDYKRAIYRFCENKTADHNDQHPEFESSLTISTRNIRICDSDKCNVDGFTGKNEALARTMNALLVLIALLFKMII